MWCIELTSISWSESWRQRDWSKSQNTPFYWSAPRRETPGDQEASQQYSELLDYLFLLNVHTKKPERIDYVSRNNVWNELWTNYADPENRSVKSLTKALNRTQPTVYYSFTPIMWVILTKPIISMDVIFSKSN